MTLSCRSTRFVQFEIGTLCLSLIIIYYTEAAAGSAVQEFIDNIERDNEVKKLEIKSL